MLPSKDVSCVNPGVLAANLFHGNVEFDEIAFVSCCQFLVPAAQSLD